MRHTLLLVAALGLIAAAGPSALAQDQDKTTQPPATPATSEPVTPGTTPSALPATYTQPVMPGQAVSPYAPAYSPSATPCGYVMPSAHIPGTVMFGSQYQPLVTNGSVQTMVPQTPYGIASYNQPGIQYGQPYPNPMPAAGSVAGSAITQPVQNGALQLGGTNTYGGVTYQPIQPGMVYPAGAVGTYSGQPVMLTGYTNGYFDSGMTTTQTGRRGLFGRMRNR